VKQFRLNQLTIHPQSGIIMILAWFTLCLLHVISYYHRISLNVVADTLMAEFNLSALALGNVAAAYSYLFFAMQIPGGMLLDRFGPRRVAMAAALLMGTGSLIFAASGAVWGIWSGRIIIGLGASVVLLSIFKFQGLWFKKEYFSTLAGTALFIGHLGGILASWPLARAVTLWGWRIPFVGVALFSLFIFLMIARLVKEPSGWARRADKKDPEAAPEVSLQEGLKIILKDKRIWFLFILNLGVYGSFIAFTGTFGASFFQEVHGLPREEAGVLGMIAIAGMTIGSAVVGVLSDRLGKIRLPLLIFLSGNCLGWILITVSAMGFDFPLLLAGSSFLVGFAGSVIALNFSYAQKICPAGCSGLATAMVNKGNFLGVVLVPPLFGGILDWQALEAYMPGMNLYAYAFLGCLLLALVALISAYMVEEIPSSKNIPERSDESGSPSVYQQSS